MTTFLDGRVSKRSLPVFQNSPPANAPGPKRLLLPQGELANFYDEDEGIRYMAFVELRIGGVRGNHFHRVKEEQFYLSSGAVTLVVQNRETGMRASIDLSPGDLVVIATGIAHAFEPTKAGHAVEFSKTRFDTADVHRFVLI
jgi:mannose-6-phosphate isomerase-like protein (cupin superfamily)